MHVSTDPRRRPEAHLRDALRATARLRVGSHRLAPDRTPFIGPPAVGADGWWVRGCARCARRPRSRSRRGPCCEILWAAGRLRRRHGVLAARAAPPQASAPSSLGPACIAVCQARHRGSVARLLFMPRDTLERRPRTATLAQARTCLCACTVSRPSNAAPLLSRLSGYPDLA